MFHEHLIEEIRERLNEVKKRLGITSKKMSERSTLRLPDETINRVLTGKTSDPGVSTLLDVGYTLGLEPYEIFMDATLAAEFKVFLELKSKSDETEAERIRIIAENESLKITNAALTNRIEMSEIKLKCAAEVIKLKDKIIELQEITTRHS